MVLSRDKAFKSWAKPAFPWEHQIEKINAQMDVALMVKDVMWHRDQLMVVPIKDATPLKELDPNRSMPTEVYTSILYNGIMTWLKNNGLELQVTVVVMEVQVGEVAGDTCQKAHWREHKAI